MTAIKQITLTTAQAWMCVTALVGLIGWSFTAADTAKDAKEIAVEAKQIATQGQRDIAIVKNDVKHLREDTQEIKVSQKQILTELRKPK